MGLLWAGIPLSLFVTSVLAVPAVAATGKQIDLTGVVTGKAEHGSNSNCSYPSKISLFRGKQPEGTLHVDICASTSETHYGGTANLKVGKITGPSRFGIDYRCPDPTCSTPAKYGKGLIFTTHPYRSEVIRINSGNGLPTKKGAQFGVVLRP